MPNRLLGAMPVLLGLALWEAVSRLGIVNAVFFPPLSSVLRAFSELVLSGELPRALGLTIGRCLEGYILAALIGVPLGFLMGRVKIITILLSPLVESLRPIPSSALIPVAILFLGIGSEMKVAVIVFGSLWPILLNSFQGVREVDPILVDTGRTLRLSRLQIARKLVLPSALPFIFVGLRISLAISLILAITVEMIAGSSGLGFLILDFERGFKYPPMYAGIFALGAAGLLFNTIFLSVQRRFLFWSGHARLET